MSEKDEKYEEEVQALVKDFGWTEENARKFLDDKVGVRRIRLSGRYLPAVLEKLIKIGVPFGETSVQFLVPESRWDEFEAAAQEAIAPQGGFVLREDEAALMAGSTGPETKH